MRDFKGSFQLSREVFESDIFFWKSDKWFKIWILIIGLCNYKDNKQFKRGECLTTYEELSHYTKASSAQVKHCLEYLRKANMIATRRTTRGLYIYVVKYSHYQDFTNYEVTLKATQKATQQANSKPITSPTIIKNDKNDKNDNIIISEQSSQINDKVDLFKPLNPVTYKKWYGNTTQRAAIGRLLEILGDKLELAINTAVQANSVKYAPTITTPLQLEEKLSALRAWVSKEKLSNNRIQKI